MSTSSSATKVMGPGTQEVPRLVGQENVFLWRRRAKAALKAREIWAAVAAPTIGPDNDKAVGLIVASLSDQVLCLISEEDSAYDIWNELDSLYAARDPGRVILIEEHIFSAKIGPSDSAEMYIAAMNKLFSKLAGAGGTLSDTHKARQMLRSLGTTWDVFVQIQTSKDDLTYGSVCNAILLESERRGATTTRTIAATEGKAMASVGTNGDAVEDKRRTCFCCRKRGHIIRHCRKRLADEEKNKRDDELAAVIKADNPPLRAEKYRAVSFYTSSFPSDSKHAWIVDSGASAHMTPYRDHLTNLRKLDNPCSIRFGDVRTTTACYAGTTTIQGLPSQQVLLVPKISESLLSVRMLAENGVTCTFKPDCASLVAANGSARKASTSQGVYIISQRKDEKEYSQGQIITCASVATHDLWHKRLGHPGQYVMKKMGYRVSSDADVCGVCQQGKQPQMPFSDRNERSHYKTGQKLHTDLCGPIAPRSEDDYDYVLTLTDDNSRLTYVQLLREKSETAAEIESFVIATERQYGWRLQVIRSDRGGEFVNATLDAFLTSRGIKHELITPYSPQSNGVAERVNRTLLDRSRCMVLQRNLGKVFGSYAIRYASVLINRVPRQGLAGKSPYEVCFGNAPRVDRLRVFGCRAYVQSVGSRAKLADRAYVGVYVGFDPVSKGHLVWLENTSCVVVRRDMVFDESCFPGITVRKRDKIAGGQLSSGVGPEGVIPTGSVPGNTHSQATVPTSAGTSEPQQGPTPNITPAVLKNRGDEHEDAEITGHNNDGIDECREDMHADENCREDERSQDNNASEHGSAHDASDGVRDGHIQPRRSSRTRQAPTRFTNGQWTSNQSHYTQAMREDNVTPIPQSYQEAMATSNSDEWRRAMANEIKSHAENGSWSLQELPPAKRAIRNRWVFAVKRSADNSTVRYKARLCAKGFEQRHGVDYESTYAPVATLTTVPLLLSLAAKHKLSVHHLDVKTAFLNSHLVEEVYMKQPDGFVNRRFEGLVCKLKRAIYGLKQASRQWYLEFDSFLASKNAHRSGGDSALYWLKISGELVILLVYVDDILVASKATDAMNSLKMMLMHKYVITDMGPVLMMLGIEIVRYSHGFGLHQGAFVLEILAEAGMQECNPASSPMEHGLHLAKAANTTAPVRQSSYRRVLGQLQYLVSGTRPDLAFCVAYLSRFCNRPVSEHWVAVKRVMRYLRGTLSLCLTFYSDEKCFDLTGYSDADWAGDREDRKSMSGILFFIGSHAISWGCKKQMCVSLSTMEAEYVALARAARELLWLCKLKVPTLWAANEPTSLIDNQCALVFAGGTAESNQSKHIDLRYHFVRDLMSKRTMNLRYTTTQAMVADIMTKSLGPTKFVAFRDLIMSSKKVHR